MISFMDITWENFWEVLGLKPADSQSGFLPPTAVFMAQAYVNLKFNFPDICYAIYNEKILIGFCKIVWVPKQEEQFNFYEDSYLLDALLIDYKFQGKGYGKEALKKMLEYVKANPWGKGTSIKLYCYEENIVARRIYKNEKFVNTNIKKDGKILFSMAY